MQDFSLRRLYENYRFDRRHELDVYKRQTLAKIIQLVEDARASKAPIAKLADKIAGIFVPVVILIAIAASAYWLIQGQSIEFALSIGISVLVISCPCALGLSLIHI